ncbi:MAG TPA: lysophospholipid acyltransferase family protein [Vicinamibacteria bacterium]|nr:lysophospholipid acyltransferase family protein [Vicinamibacteria bacterium]
MTAGGVPDRPTRTSMAVRAIVSGALRLLARREVEGLEHVPREGPCLLVFNQRSVFDTPLVSTLVPRDDVTGLVARDYRRNPFYRYLVEWGGGVWITRCSGDRSALHAALDALARGWVVGISPEGRRSRTGGLVEGKPGPAFLARRSGAPIVPLAFTHTDRIAGSVARLRRERILIRIGEPFALPVAQAGLSRHAQLREDTQLIMCRIAALLPACDRGAYAAHPTLQAKGAHA